ncbi:MAG: DUF4136 domain-containing protein [Myxococcota bacterium]
MNVDYDPNEDFSAYRTFTWFPREQRSQGDYRADSPLVDARIRKAVERELAARGYREVEDRNPDFYVAFYLSVEDVDTAVKEILARFPPGAESKGS